MKPSMSLPNEPDVQERPLTKFRMAPTVLILLFAGLNVLALGNSEAALGQEQLAFETETGLETESLAELESESETDSAAEFVSQASVEFDVPPDESEAQAPRIIFRPVNPAKIDREDESYELSLVPIQGGRGQKRIKLCVPTSVVEVEITHRTKIGGIEMAQPSLLEETDRVVTEQEGENPNEHSSRRFTTKQRPVPLRYATGRIKNPYFSSVNSIPPMKIELPKEYASTGYERIVETPTVRRFEAGADTNSKPVEKLGRPIHVQLTDSYDYPN